MEIFLCKLIMKGSL